MKWRQIWILLKRQKLLIINKAGEDDFDDYFNNIDEPVISNNEKKVSLNLNKIVNSKIEGNFFLRIQYNILKKELWN